MNRRHMLAGGLGLLALPRLTFANSSNNRKFIFIFAQGGWDPTRVFTDQLSNNLVATEADAARASVGNLHYITHPTRPSVDAFFQNYHAQSLICNGVQVRSIAHEICTRIAFTGGTSGEGADWASILAASQAHQYSVPHLVLNGPSFSGDLGAYTVRTGSNAVRTV